MAIYVCDSIMGSGKSQAAIAYMNAHPKDKFLYITPYLEEGKRIKKACPKLHFNLPTKMFKELDNSKIKHTMKLVSLGKNIATTHAAFRMYTADMIDDIKRYGYTLIMDEAADVLKESESHITDINLMEIGGMIRWDEATGTYHATDRVYDGKAMHDAYEMIKRNALVKASPEHNNLYYWELYSDILRSFKDVFVLTYLFEGQDIYYYFESHGIPYTKIGVTMIDGVHTFVDTPGHYPAYTEHLSEMINIVDTGHINDVGDDKHALSANWFQNASEEAIERLKKGVSNYYDTYKPAGSKFMWSVFKDYRTSISRAGYTRSYINCNERATNAYRDRSSLAYCVNIFANPNKVVYLTKHGGIPYENDMFALSIMLQWIWRSAIRDGKPISIYVPSSRMRGLLKDWIADTEAAYSNQNTTEVPKPL